MVDAAVLIKEATEAFEALSALLQRDEWFFGAKEPGLFDASLFAYTQLILDEELGWRYNPLKEALEQHDKLVEHRGRILGSFYSDREEEDKNERPSAHTRTTSTLGKRKTPKG